MREFWAKRNLDKKPPELSRSKKVFIQKIEKMKEVTKYAYLGIKDQLDVTIPYAVDGTCIYPFGKQVVVPNLDSHTKKERSPVRE